MSRLEIDPASHTGGDVYRFLTATVVPRPIAWVSTTSPEGIDNLAPHSFFTVACADPPIVQFTSVGVKDTLRNVRANREFVVHLACESLLDAVNTSGSDQPAAVSEFDETGLTRERAVVVAVPRVAESPVAIECRLHAAIELGDSTVVFGRVVHLAVEEAVTEPTRPGRLPHPRYERLRPLARLGRQEWGLPGRVRSLARPRYPGGRDGVGVPAGDRAGGAQPPGTSGYREGHRPAPPAPPAPVDRPTSRPHGGDAMTDPSFDPQSQLADEPPADPPEVSTGAPTPSPQELNDQDTSQGQAVSAQPTDDDPADLEDARERVEWDAGTDGEYRAGR